MPLIIGIDALKRMDDDGVVHVAEAWNYDCFTSWCDSRIRGTSQATCEGVVTCVWCWHKMLTHPKGRP